MAKNDWIVASLNNPNFTPEDMEDVLGLSVDNTQMLSMDDYERSPYIKNHEAFKNEDGSFNRDKFVEFYNDKLNSWDKFTDDEKLDSFEYSLFHTRAKADSRIRNPYFKFETVLNPDRTTIGIVGWNLDVGKRTSTPSEIAQTLKIFDPKTGKYLDETPNDRALFNNPLKWIENLFEEPLVLATYDKDTEEYDPFYDKVVKHKKGEYKLNSDGTYYYEKLNGRSIAGKQVLSNTDILTVDGSTLNKYDFFDSDSLDKSVVGTILKTAATVTPLFISAPVSTIYSGALIGREMLKTLPMLYGMFTSLFGNESEPEFLNTLAGVGEKLTGGISEYGRQHIFSFEQIGKLLGDVATQWGQQQLIAKSVAKLSRNSNNVIERAYENAKAEYISQYNKALKDIKLGNVSEDQIKDLTEKFLAGNLEQSKVEQLKQFFNIQRMGLANNWAESSFGKIALSKYLPQAQQIVQRNARLGADAALAYMALVSNYDVYNTMLEKGATHKDASIVSLMSTAGMFSVDKYLGLGEMFFNDLEDQALKHVRDYAKGETSNWIDALRRGAGMKTEEAIEGGLFKRIGLNAAKRNTEIGEASLIRKGLNLGKAIGEEASRTVKEYSEGVAHHTLGATGKAIGEGLEEMSEEFVSDISKQLYEWAGQLGVNTSIKDAGAWDEAFERYAMSFLGGALGGATFYGVGKFLEMKDKAKNPESKTAEEEMIYLLRLHRKDDIIKELDNLHKKGKLGSTKLGIHSENGVFLKAKPGEDTQNDFIHNFITQQINILDGYLNEYGANLSEDELFKQMVLADDRLMYLKEHLDGQSYVSGYRQAFLNTFSDVAKLKAEIEANKTSIGELTDRQKKVEKEEQNDLLKQIQDATKKGNSLEIQLRDAEAKLKEFLNGNLSLDYARKTIWLADPVMSDIWTYSTFDLWLAKKHNTTIDKLSEAEKKKFLSEYLNDLNYKKDFDVDQAWESFKLVEKEFNPYFTRLELNPQEILKIKDLFLKMSDLRKELAALSLKGFLKPEDRVPGETDEEFNNPETHMNNVLAYNQNQLESLQVVLDRLKDIISLFKLSGTILDPQTYRIARSMFDYINKSFAYGYAIKASIIGNKLLNAINENPSDTDLEIEYLPNITKLNVDLTKNIIKQILEISKRSIELSGKENLYNYKKLLQLQGDFAKNPIAAIQDKTLFDKGYVLDFNLIDDENAYDENDEIKLEYIDAILSDPNKILELGVQLDNKVQEWAESKLKAIFSEDLEVNIESENLQLLINDISAVNSEEDLQQFVLGLNPMIAGPMGETLQNIANTIVDFEKSVLDSVLSSNSLDGVDNILNQNLSQKLESELKTFKKALKIKGKMMFEKTLVDSWANDLKDTVVLSVNRDTFVQFLNMSDKIIKDANPFLEISKIAAKRFGISEQTLENVLDKIEQKFDESEYNDFRLDPSEEEALTYLNHIFNILKGFLYQNSVTPTWLNSFGHARFWNDFAQKHSDVVGQGFHIPELDPDISETFRSEISGYLSIIERYLNLHGNNVINKEQQFVRAYDKLVEAKKEFYKNSINYLRGIMINGASFDLLDDISDTDDIVDIESKLADNIYNILTSLNISLKEFLEQSKIIENIIPDGLEGVTNIETTDLDDKLKYSDLSPYLKFQIFISALLNNAAKFESINKSRLTPESKIAPISIQKYIVLTGKGFIDSGYVIDLLYDYLENHLPKDTTILRNAMVILGVGGAGKTSATVSQIVEDVPESEIWIAAPKESLLKTLSSAIGKNPAKSFTRDLLLGATIEDLDQYKKSLKDTILKKDVDSDLNFRKANNNFYLDTGKIKVKQITSNKPKVLVIDETTQFSMYDIQLIHRWCVENGVRLILSGDDHQLGAKEGSGIKNIFTLFYMPKLKVSLRESNIHVLRNNAAIDGVVGFIESERPAYAQNKAEGEKALAELAKLKFSEIELTYYIDDNKINGTIITKQLTDQVLNVLKSSKSVAFVGDINSDIMNLLKKTGVKIEDDAIFLNIDDIQSSEFDYVVFDGKVQLNDADYYGNYWGEIVVDQAKALYTLNTRAREGVIAIDHDFTEFYPVLNTQSSKTHIAKTIAESKKAFIDKEIERLEKLNLDGEHHDLSEIKNPSEDNSESTSSDELPETIEDIEKKQKEAEEKVTKLLAEDSKPSVQKEQELSDLGKSKLAKKIDDPNFKLSVIGYSMPVLGGYRRIDTGNKTYRYKRLEDAKVGKTTILKDLAAITILDKEIGKNDLTEEQLQRSVNKFFDLNKQIASIAVGVDTEGGMLGNYITNEHLLKILKGESTIKLADERTEGVYLEAVDKEDGDQFFGLTDANDLLITLNGKVYKYVLRFKPTNTKNFTDDLEIAITLAIAADPKTWKTKLSDYKEGTEEYNDLKEKIELYEEYLEQLKQKGNIKVNVLNAFDKIRVLKYSTRVSTLYIENRNGSIDYERGWLQQVGKYKIHSDYYILGSDVIKEEFGGLKLCNSGKVVVFVSNFDYKPEQLINIYEKEKSIPGKCTVRMLVLNNAGINWSSLTNQSYKDLYKGKNDVTTPFKADVMGYRLLTAMWNWRADLLNFLDAYKKEFTDLGFDDDKVLAIANAHLEIYDTYKKSVPTTEDGLNTFSSILNKYKVTAKDIIKLVNFNDVICKDIHTFRIGDGLGNGKHIQNINVNPEEYFGKSRIPNEIKEHGVKGLYITPQLAKEYLDYVEKTFEVFDTTGKGALNIKIYRKHGNVSDYNKRDRINGDRLGALTHFKAEDSSQASDTLQNVDDSERTTDKAGSLTTQIDRNSGIEITDNDGTVYKIDFNSKSELGSFTKNLIHLFSRLKADIFLTASGVEIYNKGKIKLETKDKDGKVIEEKVLDYSGLQTAIFDSYNRNFQQTGLNAVLNPEHDHMIFEYGDMFDLMLHGSLKDVATTGKDRDNTNKITGAMFPQGIFVDPRSTHKAEKEDSSGSKAVLLKTDINPVFLLTNATIDLVFNIELPSLSDKIKELKPSKIEYKCKYLQGKERLSIEIDSSKLTLPLTEESILPESNLTFKDVISGLTELKVDELFGGKAIINNDEYLVTINPNSITFNKILPTSVTNNVSADIFEFGEYFDSFDDLQSQEILDSTCPELIQFVRDQINKCCDKNKININDDTFIKIEDGTSNILIGDDGKLIGHLEESGDSVKIVFNTDILAQPKPENKTFSNGVPKFPPFESLTGELKERITIGLEASLADRLKKLKDNSDIFDNITGDYLKGLEAAIRNKDIQEAIETNMLDYATEALEKEKVNKDMVTWIREYAYAIPNC